MAAEHDRWLTRQQVAQLLNIHPNTVYRLEADPRFPRRSKALGIPRWSEKQLQAYMLLGQEAEVSEESLMVFHESR